MTLFCLQIQNINGENIAHLRFADDIVVIVESLEDLGTMLRVASTLQVGLKINMDKTKMIKVSKFKVMYMSLLYQSL